MEIPRLVFLLSWICLWTAEAAPGQEYPGYFCGNTENGHSHGAWFSPAVFLLMPLLLISPQQRHCPYALLINVTCFSHVTSVWLIQDSSPPKWAISRAAYLSATVSPLSPWFEFQLCLRMTKVQVEELVFEVRHRSSSQMGGGPSKNEGRLSRETAAMTGLSGASCHSELWHSSLSFFGP